MDLQLTARVLLTAFCLIQGLATVFLDLNRTHAAHPQWLGHARFHVVWQTVTAAVMAIIEACLLGFPRRFVSERFYLTAMLACAPIAGFFGALVSRRVYGGTLSDAGGITPVRIKLGDRQIQVDLSLVAEIAGVITIAAIVGLYRFGAQRL
jgi:hypothetical protein